MNSSQYIILPELFAHLLSSYLTFPALDQRMDAALSPLLPLLFGTPYLLLLDPRPASPVSDPLLKLCSFPRNLSSFSSLPTWIFRLACLDLFLSF